MKEIGNTLGVTFAVAGTAGSFGLAIAGLMTSSPMMGGAITAIYMTQLLMFFLYYNVRVPVNAEKFILSFMRSYDLMRKDPI
jgi:hypothetical protein